MFREDHRQTLHCLPLDEFDWVEHTFGTRGADPLCDGWRVAWLSQVHSDRCVVVDGTGGCAGRADALITGCPGVLLTVRTADCLPILMADRKRRVVAAMHAGWRGTAANISGNVVRRLSKDFGLESADLLVAIGPGIGPCCYEVGPEVVARLAEYLPGLRGRAGRVNIDLVEANRRQLEAAGVTANNLFAGAPCTCCHAERFHSYRREPRAGGRMISAIGIRP